MRALYKHEIKMNLKAFIIWVIAVGGMGLTCILMYTSMQDSMVDMAENFSSMGAFSDAFGMSTLSIATAMGFFATEVGTIHGLGGGIFAASLAAVMLSKEEDGHTGEFLYALPISRGKAIVTKMLAIVSLIIAFNTFCAAMYYGGFVILGEEMTAKEFAIFMIMQTLMELEIASICMLISACNKKNKLGIGIGVALFAYMYDLLARVIPSMKDYIGIGPYAYSNASEIFTQNMNSSSLIWNMILMVVLTSLGYIIYERRDLVC